MGFLPKLLNLAMPFCEMPVEYVWTHCITGVSSFPVPLVVVGSKHSAGMEHCERSEFSRERRQGSLRDVVSSIRLCDICAYVDAVKLIKTIAAKREAGYQSR